MILATRQATDATTNPNNSCMRLLPKNRLKRLIPSKANKTAIKCTQSIFCLIVNQSIKPNVITKLLIPMIAIFAGAPPSAAAKPMIKPPKKVANQMSSAFRTTFLMSKFIYSTRWFKLFAADLMEIRGDLFISNNKRPSCKGEGPIRCQTQVESCRCHQARQRRNQRLSLFQPCRNTGGVAMRRRGCAWKCGQLCAVLRIT